MTSALPTASNAGSEPSNQAEPGDGAGVGQASLSAIKPPDSSRFEDSGHFLTRAGRFSQPTSFSGRRLNRTIIPLALHKRDEGNFSDPALKCPARKAIRRKSLSRFQRQFPFQESLGCADHASPFRGCACSAGGGIRKGRPGPLQFMAANGRREDARQRMAPGSARRLVSRPPHRMQKLPPGNAPGGSRCMTWFTNLQTSGASIYGP